MMHLIAAVLLILLLLYVAALYESVAFAFLAFLMAGLVLSAARTDGTGRAGGRAGIHHPLRRQWRLLVEPVRQPCYFQQ